MKYFTIILALTFSLSLMAQEHQPKFEKSGKLVKATYYHDNGEIAQMGYYLDGKLHDEWNMFDADGKKIAMGEYQKGLRTGKWFFWNKDGIKEVDFADNKVVNVVKYDNAEALVIDK